MDYQIKKCLVCGKEFKPATANARYCSNECRKVIAKQRSTEQADRRKSDQSTGNPPPPAETPTAPPETPPETPTPPPPETPAPDEVPPTETTTPLNLGKGPEDKGESEKKSFRKFFYD